MLMLDIIELYNKVKQSQPYIEPSELKRIRIEKYGMTQEHFARLIGVVLDTYRTWEQGRFKPSSPAQSLLVIARDYPDIFLKNREKLIQFLI